MIQVVVRRERDGERERERERERETEMERERWNRKKSFTSLEVCCTEQFSSQAW